MEARIIVAVTVILIILVLGAWIVYKMSGRRRETRLRQMGRGKTDRSITPQ